MCGTIALWRYVSLGSILSCITTLVCGILFYFFAQISLPQFVFLIVSPLLIILFHTDNIKRLLAGTESKLGQKVATTGNTREKSPSAI
jgi:glycerol-3-phosphate acyltransferase PlsY